MADSPAFLITLYGHRLKIMKYFSKSLRNLLLLSIVMFCASCAVSKMPENLVSNKMPEPGWTEELLDRVLITCRTTPVSHVAISHCQSEFSKLMFNKLAFKKYGYNPYKFKDPEHILSIHFSSEVGCLNLVLNQSDDFYVKFGGNLWLDFVRTIFVRKK